jgi:hypothetical protein
VYNLHLEALTVQWLLIEYELPVQPSPVPFGIVIFVPQMNGLVFRFREDFDTLAPEDREFVAGCSATVANLAVELGAKATFTWMVENLSNTVRAEGPVEIETADVEATLGQLYRDHCR